MYIYQENSEWISVFLEALWSLLQVDSIILITKVYQSTQNKFAYLNISRKAWGMKMIFLSADKHKSFLQGDSATLGVCSQACSNYSK